MVPQGFLRKIIPHSMGRNILLITGNGCFCVRKDSRRRYAGGHDRLSVKKNKKNEWDRVTCNFSVQWGGRWVILCDPETVKRPPLSLFFTDRLVRVTCRLLFRSCHWKRAWLLDSLMKHRKTRFETWMCAYL